ncbi:helix-turn-helix domain-containing protein [Nocardioides pacificus]
MTDPAGRDRLRELLDAVLAEDNERLGDMASHAFSSPWHFSRELSRGAGEPPVAMRRRVMLERAAWQLRRGERVIDVAFAAGYESVDGFARAFARAFGHPPSSTPLSSTPPSSPGGGGPNGAARDAHWLPAPNGIHFHPPLSLWVQQEASSMTTDPLTAHLVHHDVDDTRELLRLVGTLDPEAYRRVRLGGASLLSWEGPEESIADVVTHLVRTKELWVASIEGTDHPPDGQDDPSALAERFERVAPRWLAAVRDIERRGAWGDTLVDALCDPPESFVLASVVAHVLTYAAARRQLVRLLLRTDGHAVDHGDPIEWLRGTAGTPSDNPQETP